MKTPIKARNFRYSFDPATGRYTGLIRKKPDQAEWPSNSTDISPPWPGDPQVPHWDFVNHVWTTKARDVSETEQNILFAHERAMKPSFQLLTSAVDDVLEAQIELARAVRESKKKDILAYENMVRAIEILSEGLNDVRHTIKYLWESQQNVVGEIDALDSMMLSFRDEQDRYFRRSNLFARFWRRALAALGMRH